MSRDDAGCPLASPLVGERKTDPMDVERVLAGLNAALPLQYRSALHYALTAGSVSGFSFQALGDRMWPFAEAELHDARLLVEKIVGLGGDPTTDIAPMRWSADPGEAVAALIEGEDECLAALHDIIPYTGQEPRSEALEHLLEHLILRKQNQVDFLRRASRPRAG